MPRTRLDEVALRVVEVGLEVHLPVAAASARCRPRTRQRSGRRGSSLTSLNSVLPAEDELEGEVVPQAVAVRLDGAQERQQRLGLGRAVEDAVDDGVVERLDAKTVASHEEPLFVLVPECEGEHAAQMVEAVERRTADSAARITSVSEVGPEAVCPELPRRSSR